MREEIQKGRPRGDWLSDIAALLFSCMVGLGVFVLFGGLTIINPAWTDWLMEGDPSQHYLGWVYFRDAPLWQFPLGANPLFGGKIASSIVFSDSIPLFAIPFKLIAGLLPRPFQYFGLWIAFCICMQAFFSFKVLRKLDMPIEAAAIGCSLLALAPAMLWRLYGHEALIGQWLLIAGVSLYLDQRWRGLAWIILLLVAVSVHGYLTVMVAAIWFADLCGRLLGWHGNDRPTPWTVIAAPFACVAMMWALGYFMAPGNINATARDAGFGSFKSELLTFYDSDGTWSRVLPDIPDGFYGDEGFGFVGLGPVALLIFYYGLHLRRMQFPRIEKRHWALFGLAVAFTLYSFSNRVAIAAHTIASIPLPHLLDPFLVTFRASGRFIWLASHLLVISMIVFVVRFAGRRTGAIVLACVLAVQIWDLQPIMTFFRAKFATPWENPVRAQFWNEAAGHYRRIAFVPAEFGNPNYLPMALLAAENGMEINVAYLARYDFGLLAAERSETLKAVESGALAADTLYVFSDDALFEKATTQKPQGALAATVDGFDLIAPAWKGCTDECGVIPLPNRSD